MEDICEFDAPRGFRIGIYGEDGRYLGEDLLVLREAEKPQAFLPFQKPLAKGYID